MPLRLNLASGTDIREGWINLDIVKRWPNAPRECDIVWDARTDTLPFEDNSVDEIYAGYLLLHLPPKYHGKVLADIRRVLSPQGSFMVGEVDMSVVLKQYVDNPHLPRLSELIWGEQGNYHGEDLSAFDKHCQGFTEKSLKDTLEVHGFGEISRIQIHSSEVFYELTLVCKKTEKVAVSIVLPTMRVGGLDVVFEGLKGQTFKNFELILSDGLYNYRKDIVRERAEQYDIKFKHVEPLDNPFPVNAFCRYANTGLLHAEGELILFLTDYTWLQPTGVETHIKYQLANPGTGTMGPHVYVQLPKLHGAFPQYDRPNIEDYVNDLTSGKLTDVMWSLFETPFTGDASKIPLEDIMAKADVKIDFPRGSIAHNWFHAKNESVPAKNVFDINGWDEDLDGTHCWQDTDFAERLTVKTGLGWNLEPANAAYIINPRSVFPFANRIRPVETNNDVLVKKREAGFPKPHMAALTLSRFRELMRRK